MPLLLQVKKTLIELILMRTVCVGECQNSCHMTEAKFAIFDIYYQLLQRASDSNKRVSKASEAAIMFLAAQPHLDNLVILDLILKLPKVRYVLLMCVCNWISHT